MKTAKISDMTRGWFVGNFEPTLYKTNDCEVAVKHYKEGDSEEKHYHKIATEITVVISGVVEMNETLFKEGDIVVEEPGDATAFRAVTDAVLAVVKLPGANNDKYLCD